MTTPWQPMPVTTLGKFARSLLVRATQAVVTGATSRGVFLQLNTGWIVFVSFEDCHGPLTLNLPAGKSILGKVAVNHELVIQGEKIHLPSSGIEIDFRHAEIWAAPPLPAILQPASHPTRRLQAVAGLLLSQRQEPGLSLALKDVLDLELAQLPSLPQTFAQVDCARLLQLLKTPNTGEIFSALTPLFGLGAGLTPSGDDLILGLLLAYHRWGSGLATAFDLAGLSAQLSQVTSQKTTLLSANLIACAAQGQADERLIRALDGIMTGNRTPEQCARDLMGWGNSSGGDALVGMALAILSASG